MTLNNCPSCGSKIRNKKHARNHYQKHHSGEIETSEEYLNRVESEQRDFDGEEPTTEGHNPEYLTDREDPNEDTRNGTLWEFEREKDDSLEEYQEDTE